MPRGVDDVHPHLDTLVSLVDALLLTLHPCAGGRGGRDRDPALALLLHPVGDRRPLVHLADLVDHPGVKQNALGQRGFAGINVGGDTDVACALQRKRAVW